RAPYNRRASARRGSHNRGPDRPALREGLTARRPGVRRSRSIAAAGSHAEEARSAVPKHGGPARDRLDRHRAHRVGHRPEETDLAPPDTEQSLEAELQDLFRRILACGRRQGERAALDRIVGLAQSALAEIAEPEGAGPAEAARSEPP